MRWRPAGVVLALLCCVAAVPAMSQPATGSRFDHLTTGFRLDGAHVNAECESCHVGAIFQGTPTECVGCHVEGGRIDQASAKPAQHVASSAFCDDCHRTFSWFPLAEMNHDAVYGSCTGCHNNVQSLGKPPDHQPTTQECDACHLTFAWLPARFDHGNVTPGTCSGCHDNVTAEGKSAEHVVTSAECDDCHVTTAWFPARFDHDAVAAGSCASCHDGVMATGKDVDHFLTQGACDSCHTREFWVPIDFRHMSATYPGDHRVSLDCGDCHSTNSDVVPWRFPAYAPDCAGCHADDYEPGEHRNASVSELRDCAGLCHEDRTQHSVNDRAWD